MDVIGAYLDNFKNVMKVAESQTENLRLGAQKLAEAALSGHNIFAFGCSHAGLLALELYYRTGGMALINPVRAPGLCLDIDPATMTSQMERLPEYGKVIVDNQPLGAGDVIIVHSVSGRNTVTVDVAMRAREKGAYVIALTIMDMMQGLKLGHPSGKNRTEVADIGAGQLRLHGRWFAECAGRYGEGRPHVHRRGRGHAKRHGCSGGRDDNRGGRRSAGIRIGQSGRWRRA